MRSFFAFLKKELLDAFRSGRITQLINRLHNGVECGVVADCRVGAREVVVDGARQSYNWYIELTCESLRSCDCAVATNNHQGVNLGLTHIFVRLLATLFLTKLGATSSLENCSTFLYDIAYAR